jgi:hypothetical protein
MQETDQLKTMTAEEVDALIKQVRFSAPIELKPVAPYSDILCMQPRMHGEILQGFTWLDRHSGVHRYELDSNKKVTDRIPDIVVKIQGSLLLLIVREPYIQHGY